MLEADKNKEQFSPLKQVLVSAQKASEG
jgi:hypothetical protein